MQTELVFQPFAEVETEALVALVFERDPKITGQLLELDRALGGVLTELANSGEITGRALDIVQILRPKGLKAGRLLLVGAGKPSNNNGQKKPGVFELRKVAGAAARFTKPKGIHRLAFLIPPEITAEQGINAIVTGVYAANFEPGKYRSDRQDDRRIDSIRVLLPQQQSTPELKRALEVARAIGEAQTFSRELINEPSNRLTPTIFGERARTMAQAAGLECEIIDEKRARELKMGAFLSVAQGSVEPPVMIVLKYRGASAAGKTQDGNRVVLGFVGKGITFDTGGISIKPADGMEKMKYDMAGGATMLGVMKALAELKVPIDAIAVVPATENMPGGRAQKPGDVQVSRSGKTIEVLNTDAEGRMVLADGLTYARELGATHLVDAATLTGAVAIALGSVNVGVFANNDQFYSQFARAQNVAGEKMWRLPLDDDYFEQIRGTVGDILNTGGRYGGAITAAMFLREFAQDTPWIHLDIAGTAWLDDNKAWMAKGPSGVALPTLVELAVQMSDSKPASEQKKTSNFEASPGGL